MVWRIAEGWSATPAQVEEALEQGRFAECGPTQERAAGWVPPRGEAHGALVEVVDGQMLLRLMVESKAGAVLSGQAQGRGARARDRGRDRPQAGQARDA